MGSWVLLGFLEQFDVWVDRDGPDQDLQLVVMSWIHSLQDAPYRDAVRRLELSMRHWFAVVPESSDGIRAATCLYQIDPEANEVGCDVIATLRLPLL